MKTVKLAENVYWVGAVDWYVRDFHGYSTNRGSTYNAFLIIDEKITLIDCVKKPYHQEMMHNIRNIIDPKKIDYIVVNHVEMDHSGCLPEVIKEVQPEKIFCSKMGLKGLLNHFHQKDWPYEVVTPGNDLKTGLYTLSFLETKMLHWPDSMFTYLQEEQILFSSDAFGQHLAASERFDDEFDMAVIMHEATKYYANILTPFSALVQKLLASVKEMNLPLKIVAPDHGIIWRKHIGDIVQAYDRWSAPRGDGRALVIYDSMWKSTTTMAKAVAKGLENKDINYRMFDLQVNHHSDIMTEVLEASAILLGCPTLNNGILPRMAAFLMYMKGLKPLNKLGASFGSYGWSGESVKMLNQTMVDMKFTICHPGLKVQYVPEHSHLHSCVELGETVGRAINDVMNGKTVTAVEKHL